MSQNQSRKFLFAFVCTFAVSAIVAVVVLNRKPPAEVAPPTAVESTAPETAVPNVTAASAPAETTSSDAKPAPTPTVTAPAGRLVARAPRDPAAPASLGSFDPKEAAFRLDFSNSSAGLERITFSNFWNAARPRAVSRMSIPRFCSSSRSV